MNFSDLINAFCALVFTVGVSVGGYQAYKFVRNEVIEQSHRGLPSLEKFSEQLSAPRNHKGNIR